MKAGIITGFVMWVVLISTFIFLTGCTWARFEKGTLVEIPTSYGTSNICGEYIGYSKGYDIVRDSKTGKLLKLYEQPMIVVTGCPE